MAGTGVLIVDHLDPPSLAALLTVRESRDVVLWHPGTRRDDVDEQSRGLLHRHAGLCACERIIRAAVPDAGDQALNRSVELFAAAVAAVTHGCTRLVWPIDSGGDPEIMLRELDRANLCSALLDAGGERNRVEIDLPVVDLEDWQIVDLIEEGGATMADCLSCGEGGREACNACRSCQRWRAACERADAEWPWAGAAV